MWMLQRFYLLFLALLVLPLATKCDVVCIGHGNPTASKTLEANIHDFVAILPNKTSSAPSHSSEHATGEYPERMYAVSHCHNGTNSSFCQACISLALQEAHTVCPYHKGVVFSNANCSLKLSALIYATPWEWDDHRKEVDEYMNKG
uniref:Uncharacterized protein n=1 Tax=Aegilops tauschii TaxID=37682 RepID=M8C9M4_AEGTA